MSTAEELKALKVAELKAKLSDLGLSKEGKKDELIERLVNYYQKQKEEEQISKELKEVEDLIGMDPSLKAAEKSDENGKATELLSPKTVPASKELTEAEKRLQRSQRFNIPASLEDKKAERAKRFSIDGKDKPVINTDPVGILIPFNLGSGCQIESKTGKIWLYITYVISS
jgi:SAP domain-containing ribonucleoprotein